MARIAAGAADLEGLPRAYTRAHGKPIGWQRQARCRNDDQQRATPRKGGGEPSIWLVDEDKSYVFGGRRTPGAKLVEMALLECSLCSVQWDCAAFAVTVREPTGVWAMSLDDREWLQRNVDDPVTFIKQAYADGVTVQVAVRNARPTEPC